MLDRVRSILSDAWPFVGAAYLAYLALRPPPVRYVGVGGLMIVTPLLFGWTVGRLFGVGPWANDGKADGVTADDGKADDGRADDRGADGEAPDEGAG